MPTLDEVIRAIEECRDSYVAGKIIKSDALHYLKECKKDRENPDGDHQQLEKCRALLQDFYRNDPLTWDELTGMEGKPVYVVYPTMRTKGWALVDYVDDDRIDFTTPSAMRLTVFERQMGKTWQAYRKERE